MIVFGSFFVYRKLSTVKQITVFNLIILKAAEYVVFHLFIYLFSQENGHSNLSPVFDVHFQVLIFL